MRFFFFGFGLVLGGFGFGVVILGNWANGQLGAIVGFLLYCVCCDGGALILASSFFLFAMGPVFDWRIDWEANAMSVGFTHGSFNGQGMLWVLVSPTEGLIGRTCLECSFFSFFFLFG